MNRHLSDVLVYPDEEYRDLVDAIAAAEDVPAGWVVIGNGSEELLYALARGMASNFGIGTSVVIEPACGVYRRAAALAGLHLQTVALRELVQGGGTPTGSFPFSSQSVIRAASAPSAVWIGRPNNPTGTMPSLSQIETVAKACPESILVVDESFLAFTSDADRSAVSLLFRAQISNVVVLRSLSSFYAVPGIRAGYAICSPSVAATVRALLPPRNINALASAFTIRALSDHEYSQQTRKALAAARDELVDALGGLLQGGTVGKAAAVLYESPANFVLIRLNDPFPRATEICRRLLALGVAVHDCADCHGVDERYIRVTVRDSATNQRLLVALRKALPEVLGSVTAAAGASRRPGRGRRTASLMIQGTASNVGKSVLVAAFCRILLQDGYRVAPFKAQNISLNSFVTADGGEMGRAQVVQAQACRVEPDVRMNPVLIKSSAGTGPQIIVRGHPVEGSESGRYFQAKRRFFEAVKQSYDELAAEYDVIVLEGAGSPGEVNLKKHDIVNMQMAAYAEAPVLLAGDIDRGGVFASLIGTMDVLEEWERELVAGFLVNKFRGDSTILKDALDYTLEYTGKPVFGVIPMMPDLGLPEEDSVSFQELRRPPTDAPTSADTVRIGLIDLPDISNFTDVDALRIEPDVDLAVVRSPKDLENGGPFDALILPGSKSVVSDLEYLRRTGLADALGAAAASTMIVGICGGYQMLGERIEDPDSVESRKPSVPGLGLLGASTSMGRDKVLRRRTVNHLGTNIPVHGYEIHHGRTARAAAEKEFVGSDGEALGASAPLDGGASGFAGIWGTYLHGVFDSDEFRRGFIDALRVRRGLAPTGTVAATYEIETALDRLADTVRAAVDMDAVYRILDLQSHTGPTIR